LICVNSMHRLTPDAAAYAVDLRTRWSDGGASREVEVYVAARQQEPRCRSDPNIVAVVTDDPVACAVLRCRPDDVDGLCRFLAGLLGLAGRART
jgi:hypothetical protein